MVGAPAKPAKGTAKAERQARRKALTAKERAAMAAVRKRDPRCRFPKCGCHKRGWVRHVAHSRHRGMGGNPAGDRTQPALMVAVCGWRHNLGWVTLHAGNIRWEALTPFGADGPIRWLIVRGVVDPEMLPIYVVGVDEYELAREVTPGRLEPLTPWQARVLHELSFMSR